MRAGTNIRERVREIIERLRGEPEKPKLDFKRWKNDVGLAKVISAIANTDGEPATNPLFNVLGDDYGLVVLGISENGEVVGIPTKEEENQAQWLWEKEDTINGTLADKLGKWVAPIPQVEAYVFEEEDKRLVAFLIFPSSKQPHVFVRNGEGVRQGDWYVRRLSSTERAGPEDMARVMQKPIEALRREISRVEERLSGRLEEAFAQIHRWNELLVSRGLDTLAQEVDLTTQDAVSLELEPHERIRRRLGRPADPVAEALNEAFDRLTSGVKSAGIPWAPHPTSSKEAKRWIERLEEAALPALKAVATLVALDEEGNYASLLQERLETYAEDFGEVPVNTTFNEAGHGLYLYPLVLLHYTVAIVAYAHGRAAYLHVLKEAIWRRHSDRTAPQVPAVRDTAIWAGDIFQFANPKTWCDPIADRAQDLLLQEKGVLREALPSRSLRDPQRLFVEAELVLALIALKNTGGERPFFGNYLYGYTSTTRQAACRLLENGSFLEEVLGKPIRQALEELLQVFRSMSGRFPCTPYGISSLERCLEEETASS